MFLFIRAELLHQLSGGSDCRADFDNDTSLVGFDVKPIDIAHVTVGEFFNLKSRYRERQQILEPLLVYRQYVPG